MITIKIAYDVSPAAIEQIRQLVAREIDTNVNLSGSEFVIERDDYTFINAHNEYDPALVQLFSKIMHIIDGVTV